MKIGLAIFATLFVIATLVEVIGGAILIKQQVDERALRQEIGPERYAAAQKARLDLDKLVAQKEQESAALKALTAQRVEEERMLRQQAAELDRQIGVMKRAQQAEEDAVAALMEIMKEREGKWVVRMEGLLLGILSSILATVLIAAKPRAWLTRLRERFQKASA